MTVLEHYDPFARQLADLLARLSPKASPAQLTELKRLTYFISEQTQRGIIAAPLEQLEPALDTDLIQALEVVGQVGAKAPLILSATHAWFYRYWQYEQHLGQTLNTLLTPTPVTHALTPELNTLFQTSSALDWQKVAAALALQQRFVIISGGPGTGKTTTVTRILALLLQLPDIDPTRIQLAAPTGKAAMRLQESIKSAQAQLPASLEIKQQLQAIPSQTLHRLLGYRPGRNEFNYNAAHPLPVDVLVIDEASMMDIALLTHVLAALPAQARLILLGDKDQLAAVETGSVFRDLCEGASNQFSKFTAEALQAYDLNLPAAPAQTKLNDHIVILEQSYRFNESSGIGQLAQAIRSANLKRLKTVLHSQHPELTWHAEASLPTEQLIEGWQHYFEAIKGGDIAECFAAFNRFRILSPMRQGLRGTETLNEKIEHLASKRLPAADSSLRFQGWYVGRPVMVIRNDYNQNLFNGDIGIALKDDTGQLRVYFPDAAVAGQYRHIAPVRLPQFESAWAMTIHKSQGSEFDEVLLVMPDDTEHALLGRELLYTGVTRTRQHLQLVASLEVLNVAVERSIPPSSCILAYFND